MSNTKGQEAVLSVLIPSPELTEQALCRKLVVLWQGKESMTDFSLALSIHLEVTHVIPLIFY